jgi:hypothetical protein
MTMTTEEIVAALMRIAPNEDENTLYRLIEAGDLLSIAQRCGLRWPPLRDHGRPGLIALLCERGLVQP